jgi:hypothetical protein
MFQDISSIILGKNYGMYVGWQETLPLYPWTVKKLFLMKKRDRGLTDPKLNLFFLSSKYSETSKEIRKNRGSMRPTNLSPNGSDRPQFFFYKQSRKIFIL